MSHARTSALCLGLALVASGVARAEDLPLRLVEPLPETSYGQGTHQVSISRPPSTGARWFLTAAGEGPAFVEVDGRQVVAPLALAGPRRDRATVEVSLRDTSLLRIRALGQQPLRVRVFGLVPAADLPAGTGKGVAPWTAFDGTFPAGLIPRHTRLQLPIPAHDGVFFLTARQAGARPVILARLL